VGEVWIKEAEDLTPVGSHNAMSGIGGPRATLHCTVSRPGSYDAMVKVLRDKRAESHLVYDPLTDRLGQFFPLDRAARALARGTLDYSHNRVGSINIQVEVCAMPVDWTAGDDWRPGPNFRAMIRAIRSWGIRDEFIYRPARTSTDRANVVRPKALLTSTEGGGKWWGHCHYGDGETHWDPGPINLDRFFGAAPNQEDELADITQQNVIDIFTKHAVMLNPTTGQRVAPSAVIESAARDAAEAEAAVKALTTKVAELTDKVNTLANKPAEPVTVQLDPVQLEAALRKVIGSVDNVGDQS
jgi:hypothetical protein